MLLNSKFDVLRGWPREGAIDEVFPINQTVPGTDDLLPLGMVFFVNTTGKAEAATTPNRAAANAVATWVVVAGNDDFSSQFTHKVVGLRSNAEFKLDPSNFNAGVYTPGVKLTFSAGKWQPAVATNQIIGEVLQDNTATDGTIVVMYTGGDAAAL
jgi:hypothetical protein